MREVLFVVAEEASHPRLRGGFLAKRRDWFAFCKFDCFCALFVYPELKDQTNRAVRVAAGCWTF